MNEPECLIFQQINEKCQVLNRRVLGIIYVILRNYQLYESIYIITRSYHICVFIFYLGILI